MDSTYSYVKIDADFVEKEKIVGERNELIKYYQLYFGLKF